ncbi:MAG: hypothetical protein MK228_05875, partial [Nitrososphaerales archaeon]|nr:hypothetical protein [Nitrososphaerales archaeon]
EGINSYTGTMQVKQISKDSSDFPKTYEFMNVWPSSTGEIALSWDTNDIQAFDVTWEYNYWRSPDSDVGMEFIYIKMKENFYMGVIIHSHFTY